MSIKSVTTNQKSGLVEQKRWNAKARDALSNHQPFYLCYYGALAVIPGLMFIDLSNGFGICRIPDDHMVACETDAGVSDTTLSSPASAYCS